MELQTTNVYFSMLTMATEIIAYLGLQLFFFPLLNLFSCEQQLKKPMCIYHSIERIKFQFHSTYL